ncbi:MAG: diaminopimelate epimerase [Thermacetogeniaceae bacterium]
MEFAKWQGLGNDFILLDGRPERWPAKQLADLASRICDRHFGIGGDGLIFVFKDDRGMVNMRIFNADGSEPEMCGNGIRCVAKYAYQRGLVSQTAFPVLTRAGVMLPKLILDGDRVAAVQVDMGEPVLERDRVPALGVAGTRMIGEDVQVGSERVTATAVSMGNPHCLVFVPDVAQAPVYSLGPLLERHELFPNHTNVEFIEVRSDNEIAVRVWERGVGETLACGTGACASVAGSVLTGRTGRLVRVNLPGGQLLIEWADNNHLFMTGPAEEVFTGRLGAAFRECTFADNGQLAKE